MDPPEKKRKVGDIEFFEHKKLGKGGFGTVYEGTFNGKKVAVKRTLHDNYEAIETEFLQAVSHPNLIKFIAIEKDLDFMYIAMEQCAGTLQEVVDKTYEGPDPGPMESLLFQTALGLHFLHSQKIIHRDIKPQNILISDARYGQSAIVKLADFGLCKKKEDDSISFSKSKSVIGTLGWSAPESFQKEEARMSYSSDVFSLGCVFGYALTGGSHPFGDESYAIPKKIINGRVNWENEHLIKDEELTSMIIEMISKEPADRPSLPSVLGRFGFRLLESPFVTNSLVNELLGILKTCVDAQCDMNLIDDSGRNCVMSVLEDGDEYWLYGQELETFHKERLNILLSDAALPLIDINHKDKRGRNALYYLCKHYRGDDITQFVKLLINPGINVNETFDDCKTSLHLFVRNYKGTDICDVMQLFIDAGADVNVKDFSDLNVLHHLCLCNSSHPTLKEAVALLIKSGVKINQVDKIGRNALMISCSTKQDPNTHEVIKFLLENGIGVTAKTKPNLLLPGYDALLLLCKFYKGDDLVDIVQTLVENGADMNSKTLRGENALHLVCENYRNPKLRDVIQYLIEKGIDENAKDVDGHNAIYYLRNRHPPFAPSELEKLECEINWLDNLVATYL